MAIALAEHWDIRENIKHFREPGPGREARYVILRYLTLRANTRLRCWPGLERIEEDTGFDHDTVSAALQWLFDHGAIYNIPYGKRVGEELNLPNRKYIYQLTGVIVLNGKRVPYILMSDDTKEEVFAELEKIGADELIEMLQGSENEPSDSHDRKNRSSDSHDRKNQRWKNQRWENRPKGIQESFEGIPDSEVLLAVPEKSTTATPRKSRYSSKLIDAEAGGEKKKIADPEAGGTDAVDMSDYTDLEMWIVNQTRATSKGLSPAQRRRLASPQKIAYGSNMHEEKCPNDLWDSVKEYSEYCARQYTYQRNNTQGKVRTGSVVNLVCDYGSDFGWFAYKQKHGITVSTNKTLAPIDAPAEWLQG